MNEFLPSIVQPSLRDYQIDVRDRVRKLCTQVPKPIRILLQASTGAGKSVIALNLMLRCHMIGKRCLFMVSGRVLVDQIEKHLARANVPYGIIMAGRGRNEANIQIASKETLASRGIRNGRMKLPTADLVIIDEAHESIADEWLQLLDKYQDAVVIGLTATPALGNGKGLGKVWNGLEMAVTTRQLVEENWLVPCRVYAPDKPDLRGVKIVKGDYQKDDLAARMDRPKLTGSVFENWRKIADGRRTVIFGCNIAHAKHINDEFSKAGIKLGHIDQTTEDAEREDIFGAIADGNMLGFTNVSVARRGLDLPCLEVACVVRPTRSLVLWLQMIGRIRRPAPGKTESIVIDHAGACDYHCMPDDEIDWRLDAKENVSDRVNASKEKQPKTQTCPECSCMFVGKRCPSCGYTFPDKSPSENTVEHADGILVERERMTEQSYAEMQRGWNHALAIAVNRDRKIGMAAALFKEQFGMLPWEVRPRLANMPKRRKGEWQRNAAELFPGFKRG
jgi:superfamily II DNA or RNA helicase